MGAVGARHLAGAGSPRHRQLLNGQPYVGYARLFGKDYVTRYQPVRDAQGQVIALLFVGADITAIVQQHVHDAVQVMRELRQQADVTGQQAKASQQGLATVALRITHVAVQLTSIAATEEEQCADDARVVSASAEALGTVALELRDAVAVFR